MVYLKIKLRITIMLLIVMCCFCGVEICPAYKCRTPRINDYCAEKTIDEESKDLVWHLTSCSSSHQMCPYFQSTTDKSVKCVDKQATTLKSYPGYSCKVDSDCIGENSKCESQQVCSGISEGNPCQFIHECKIGMTCNKATKKCVKQKSRESECEFDTDCQNSMGCLNKKCTEYFSLGDNDIFETEPSSIFSMCNSLKYIAKDGKFYCRKLSLKDVNKLETPCDTSADCLYSYMVSESSPSENIKDLNNSCVCGYNNKQLKYCRPMKGDMPSIFDKYVEKQIEFLKNKNCHTLERQQCKDNSINFKNLNDEVEMLHFEVYEAFKFKSSMTCLKKLLFPYLKETKSKTKCPKFYCDSVRSKDDEDTCVKIIRDDQIDQNTVNLYNCNENQYCPVFTNFNFENENSNFFIKCLDKSNIKTKINRSRNIHIEPCESNSKEQGQMCEGYNAGEQETKHEKDEALEDSDSCKKFSDCDSDQVCFEGKCIAYRSLKLGTSVKSLERDQYLISEVCEFGIAYNDKCAGKVYHEDGIEEGVKKCQAGYMCKYRIEYMNGVFAEYDSEPCQCGFNKDGQGYCPISHRDEDNIDKWMAYNNAIRAQLKSSCSKNDQQCIRIIRNKSYFNKRFDLNTKFVNSEACAYDIFTVITTAIHIGIWYQMSILIVLAYFN